jgi:alpha-D-ribose 1-methylphosphonate 5-triphosphate synthase subunit PhnL
MTNSLDCFRDTPIVSMRGVSKHFVLHHQNGAVLPVFEQIDLEVRPSECVVLDGPSGMGKSTLLKLIYGNYRPTAGDIWVNSPAQGRINISHAIPRELLDLRRTTIGYVSQFLRVIPRVSALDVVAEPLIENLNIAPSELRAAQEQARECARQWLARLRIPERLWSLPPSTFSGGEQQRINIARSLIKPKPLLLLDEPTASLDPANTRTVIDLIEEALERGAAVLGIFHDRTLADAVATRRVPVASFRSRMTEGASSVSVSTFSGEST